jgi:hypothetical protein
MEGYYNLSSLWREVDFTLLVVGRERMGNDILVYLNHPTPTPTQAKPSRSLSLEKINYLLLLYTIDVELFYFHFDILLIYIFPHTGSSQGAARNVYSQKNG